MLFWYPLNERGLSKNEIRNTVIKIPQISREKLNQEESKQVPERKGLLGWLFGK